MTAALVEYISRFDIGCYMCGRRFEAGPQTVHRCAVCGGCLFVADAWLQPVMRAADPVTPSARRGTRQLPHRGTQRQRKPTDRVFCPEAGCAAPIRRGAARCQRCHLRHQWPTTLPGRLVALLEAGPRSRAELLAAFGCSPDVLREAIWTARQQGFSIKNDRDWTRPGGPGVWTLEAEPCD